MVNIVVVGAGVSGLTTALLLAREKKHTITVVAKFMPGDYDIEYTSPWAGANVLPMNSAAEQRWERRSWPELSRLAADVPEAGIHFQKCKIMRREADANKPDEKKGGYDPLFDANPWYTDMFPDHRFLRKEELPEGYVDGAQFTSVCINTALYLPWLVGQCRAAGVVVRRGVLKDIGEAKGLSAFGGEGAGKKVVVVNCTGLQACRNP